MSSPARGDVWWVALDPVRGHEQAGTRPAVVLSVDGFNRSPLGLVVVLPVTRTHRPVATHVRVSPPEGGLTCPSSVMCEQPRVVSVDRLSSKMGAVTATTMASVEDRVRRLLGL